MQWFRCIAVVSVALFSIVLVGCSQSTATTTSTTTVTTTSTTTTSSTTTSTSTSTSTSTTTTNEQHKLASIYMGAVCNVATGNGCNPNQLPQLTSDPFPFNPSYQLLQEHAYAITINPSQSCSGNSVTSLVTSAASMSTSDASGFGLSASVSYLDMFSFSASASYHSMVQSMNAYSDANYYAESAETCIIYTAALDASGPPTLDSAFKAAYEALPPFEGTQEDQDIWFNFFAKYGTHYVASIAFGGFMKRTITMSESIKQKEGFSEEQISFGLGAMLKFDIGESVQFDGANTQEMFQKFENSATFSQDNFIVVGGDATAGQEGRNYSAWKTTIATNPAPVRTTLGSMGDLMPASLNFDSALEMYFASCPHTTQGGICNGYGICDFTTGTCTCSAGAYLESDNNCYPQCPSDCNSDSTSVSSSGQGQCSFGKCLCNVVTDPFGYNAGFGWYCPPNEVCDCSATCGKFDYDAGAGLAWFIPGMPASYFASPQNPSCWCQKATGFSTSLMKGTVAAFSCTDCDGNNYFCDEPDTIACTNDCMYVETFSCQFGGGPQCPNSPEVNILIDDGRWKPMNGFVNRTVALLTV